MTLETESNRHVIPVRETFSCDGAWYVLTSGELGGSGLSADDIGERLQSPDSKVIRELLAAGTCLPLYFPGDCALDEAVIVVGDLSGEEEREWIGRLRSTLEVPSGEFILVAGGLEEDFEEALTKSDPDPDGHQSFEKVTVEPGRYLVEVYAFLGSLTTNEEWEDLPEDAEPIREWWTRTHPGEDVPQWVGSLEDEEYVDSEEFDLLEYVIRLRKLVENEPAIPLPGQDEGTQWCNVFEFRRPDPCPRGIPQKRYRDDRE